MRTLVLGGARSGKSSWAERELLATAPAATTAPETSAATSAAASHTTVLHYIATARPWPGDSDFSDRVAGHRSRRKAQETSGISWRTIDDVDAVDVLRAPDKLGERPRVLLDDVGTWLTHVFDARELWDAPRGSVEPWTRPLVDAVRNFPAQSDLFIVSPEVGFGVIPEHRSGRLFRDEIGLLNQQLAAVCDRVVLVVAGCPLEVKRPG